ncbi:pyrroloquinoline quinone-dependent dehydrogenase [Salinibacter sp. 10B]|uniref:pyrroloquinoline quinone-dependent dehydrogenase n=1 Tax=Salinibacter sp. 10B TaxID=1923971 RepID=UPI001C612770|nr:pyrroloquinoline quinone-dependent dehydrogenase [Salinibacter sp. 10B]
MGTLLLLLIGCGRPGPPSEHEHWRSRGGGPSSIRYSSLTQIDTATVDRLERAWTYHTKDATERSQIQANPIVVDGTLYGTSPQLKVIALDAASGEEQWTFDPLSDSLDVSLGLNANRGVTYWRDEGAGRILVTAGPFLFALNATDGSLIESFGNEGRANLKQGLGGWAEDLYVSATSPGVIYQDLLIIGSRVSEGADAAPGDIRAFNVRTGTLEWTFHTIPRPGEFGHDTWADSTAWQHTGGANSWAGMSVDRERGIVYVPTGSASPDFYGGNRKGKNLFANTLLALDAATGERIWHYQTVHHDLWDRDLPSPPSLVTVQHEGEQVDAVAQTTKTGFVFVFNRETGEPLFPIEERPVPTQSPLQGEEPWPTQPGPTAPEPFLRQHMTTADINPYVSDSVQAVLRSQLQSLNRDHMFEPPSLRGTLMFPGFDGGAEWGGNAFNPTTDILYVNSNEVPWVMTMLPAGADAVGEAGGGDEPFAVGEQAYRTHCMSCHGPDRTGGGDFPSLKHVGRQYEPQALVHLIRNGRRMMPGFDYLSAGKEKAIVNFLLRREHYALDPDTIRTSEEESSDSPPYVMAGYDKFRTPEGYPAVSPPWGTLNAINLATGEFLWRTPLGTYPELAADGIPPTGTENYGGPVATAGGLVFIAATLDKKIRAFHQRTGEVLWSAELPAAGFATPSIYEANGTQYVVIACGGGKLGTESGDAYVAFALPSGS